MSEQVELWKKKKKLAEEAFWLPSTRGLRKDSDRAVTPAAEAGRVPARLVPPESLQPTQLNPHRDRAVTGNKKSCIYASRVALVMYVQLCDPVDCGLPGFSVRGCSRQEHWSVLANAGCHTLLERCVCCCPSRQIPRTWCCQSPCNPSSCTTSTPGPHRGKPKSSRADSGANSRGRPTCRGGNKVTDETQGQCGWGRRPKTFPPAAQAAGWIHTI